MPLSPAVLANFQQSQAAQQGGAPVDYGTFTVPNDTPAPAPGAPTTASPADDRGYIERGADWIAGIGRFVGQAHLAAANALAHPAQTAQSAGQAALNWGKPSQQPPPWSGPPPEAAPQQPQGVTQPQQPPPQPLITPMVTRPAHEVRAVSPGTEALFNQGIQQQQAANEAGSQADIAANEAGAQATEAQGKVSAALAEESQRAEADRRRRYDETNAEYQQVADRAARGEIQPKQIGMMGRIGIALGALGASVTHTPNFALENIHKQIDEQLAADRTNLENKNRAADRKENDLARLRDRFGDERQAEAAYRALKLQEAKATGDALVARAQSPVLAAKWQAVKAGATTDQAKLHNMMFPWQQASVVGGQAQKPLENVFMNVDGQRYQARDADSRKRLAISAANVQDITSQAQDYQKMLQAVGTGDRLAYKTGYTTEAMARAQGAYNAFQGSLRKAKDDGVWKKGEVEMLAQTLTPPEHFSGDPVSQSQLAIKQANDAHSHTMVAEDALPVQQQFVQNPQTGQLAPRNPYTGGTVKPQAPPASRLIREIPK